MQTSVNLIQSFVFSHFEADISPILNGLIEDFNNITGQIITLKTGLRDGAGYVGDILGTIFSPKGSSINIPKGIHSGFDPKWLDSLFRETVDSSTLRDYLGDPCKMRKPLMNKTHFCLSALSDILHEAGFKCCEFCDYTKNAALDYINSLVPDNNFIVYAIPTITIHLQDVARIVFDLQLDDDDNSLYLESENNLFCIGNVFDIDINVWRSNSQLRSAYSTRVDVTNNLDDLRNAVRDRDAAADDAVETFNNNMDTYDEAQRAGELDDETYDDFNTIDTRIVRASHQTTDIIRSILGDHDSSYWPEPRGENAIHFSHITISESDITYVTPNSDLSGSTTHQAQASPEASVYTTPQTQASHGESVYTTPNSHPDENSVIDDSEEVENIS